MGAWGGGLYDSDFARDLKGTIDAVQSDEATMASPVDIAVFGGYFPFATRYSLDVPAMFQYYGLKEIWEEAYAGVENVTWLSCGAWDPLHIFTVNKPIRSLADMQGLRVRLDPGSKDAADKVFELDGDGLRMLDGEGKPIDSPLPYRLKRDA